MAWPYRVTARWREPLPSAFGCRYQTMSLNRVLEGSQQIDFRFDPFPQGTAKLTGRVLDQKGRPVEGFFLRVLTASSDQLRQAWEELDGKTHTYTGYDMPFVSKDGSFELGGLPEGAARSQVIPFEGRRYEHGNLKDVSLAAGQAASLDFQLTGKDVFYGRVLFEDGTPAVIRPAPWPGAATRILLARSRTYRAPGVSEVDAQGYFAVYLDEGGREELASGQLRLSISLPAAEEHRFNTVGDFPVDKLSQDRSQAGVIQVKRPESPTPAPTEKPHAIDESLATNTPENVKPADSQAWYVMRQVNGAPLLPGLTQQLLKVLPPARQDDVMWREVAGGGSLKLDVKVEQETGREIVVGLFQDAKWSQEPVAVRLLPKEGTYTLTGLPAGRVAVNALAFDYRPYRHEKEKEKEVVLAAGKTTDIHFEMIHNQRFYGRVLFEDGRPAVARPVPWEGAKTTIRIDETRPFGLAGLGRTRHDVAEVDAGGRFCVYLPDPELEGLRSGTATLRIRLPGKHKDEWQSGGTFPFEKLAEDQTQAGTVTIQRPEYLKAPAVPIATEKAAFPIELSSVGSPEETLKARQLYLNPDADPFLRELRRRTVEYANARTSRARREVVSPLSSSETACSSAVSTLA